MSKYLVEIEDGAGTMAEMTLEEWKAELDQEIDQIMEYQETSRYATKDGKRYYMTLTLNWEIEEE